MRHSAQVFNIGTSQYDVQAGSYYQWPLQNLVMIGALTGPHSHPLPLTPSDSNGQIFHCL